MNLHNFEKFSESNLLLESYNKFISSIDFNKESLSFNEVTTIIYNTLLTEDLDIETIIIFLKKNYTLFNELSKKLSEIKSTDSTIYQNNSNEYL